MWRLYQLVTLKWPGSLKRLHFSSDMDWWIDGRWTDGRMDGWMSAAEYFNAVRLNIVSIVGLSVLSPLFHYWFPSLIFRSHITCYNSSTKHNQENGVWSLEAFHYLALKCCLRNQKKASSDGLMLVEEEALELSIHSQHKENPTNSRT